MNIENHDELIAYLRARCHIGKQEQVRATTLAGGVSCNTVLIHCSAGPNSVVKQALEKLKVQQDWYSDPMRIHREAAAIRQLNRIAAAARVPQFYFEDHELHLLAMEAVPEPHDNWKTLLLDGKIHDQYFEQFGRFIADVHRISFNDARMRSQFHDRRFFESLRIEPYYLFTAQQVPEARDFLQRLISETRQVSATLVHGDYSPKNVLIHQDQLRLVDHEVMHFGDGTFDIGFSMTHLLSKANHVVGLRSAFIDAARIYWRTYRNHFEVDTEWEQRAIRHTVACMLARVDGKSPLEYLSDDERLAQRQLCLEFMVHIPSSFDEIFVLLRKERS